MIQLRTTLSLVLIVVTFASPTRASDAVSAQTEWQASADDETKTIGQGELTVRLSRYPKATEVPENAFTQIQIEAPGIPTAKFHAENAFGPGATVQFAELDTKNRFPEILFSTYTGGAHCCFETMVLTFNGMKWVAVPERRGADGAAPEARDLDDDGRAEITEPDGIFLYAFSGYAASIPPNRIYRLSGLKWIDVSRQSSFHLFHLSDQVDLENACDEKFKKETQVNGFWAGHVASSLLNGDGRAAWNRMLGCYDRTESWGLCKPYKWQSFEPQPTDFGPVPAGMKCDVKFRSFPIALHEFLRSNGYGAVLTPKELAALVAGERNRWDAERRRIKSERDKVRGERLSVLAELHKIRVSKSRVDSTQPRTAAASQTDEPPVRSSRRPGDTLWQQVYHCWTPPDLGSSRILPRVLLRMRLSSEGSLVAVAASTQILDLEHIAVRAAIKAAKRCAPYSVRFERPGEEREFKLTF